MSIHTLLKVVTAYDLLEGDAVWLTSSDNWTQNICKAEVMEGEAFALKRLTQAKARTDEVIDSYLSEIQLGPNGPIPVHYREILRTRGPSNYAHGKQATIPTG